MGRQRFSTRRLIVVTLLALAGGLTTAAAAPSAATPARTDVYVGYLTDAPVPMHANLSRAALNTLIAKTERPARQTSTRSPATPSAVVSGYTLYNPGRISSCFSNKCYVYDSDPHYMTLEHCTVNGCTLSAEVKAWEHEYIRGGSSKYWDLTENAATVENPGGQSWTYTAIYYCAVNVSGSPDHYCGNGADASGIEAPMTPGETVGKMFENVNNNTVYPMVGITVHYNVGVTINAPFRDWDTCNRATSTALCPTSGTGA